MAEESGMGRGGLFGHRGRDGQLRHEFATPLVPLSMC